MRLLPSGLSGRLLVLTAAFIMLVEVLIFVPSVANYRLTWLARHFTTGEAAALALQQVDPSAASNALGERLLRLTSTEMIVLRADGASRVLAQSAMPGTVEKSIMLRMPGREQALASIAEAFDTLLSGGGRTIRVVGPMTTREGELELVMTEDALRSDMLTYAANVMLISLMISVTAALLVFLVLRWLLIRPMQRISQSMLGFAEDPEDTASVIAPSGRRDEIGIAEEQLAAMQGRLRGTFQQQRHLAELGLAVSKINHDLRNVLAAASLFSERMSSAADPLVQKLAPRLVRTIDRAADYAASVLAYGRAGEALPQRRVVRVRRLVEDVAETLGLDAEGATVEWVNDVPEALEASMDAEQMFRVLANLGRNAVQAMEKMPGNAETVRRFSIEGERTGQRVTLRVCDTGPGFPPDARATLFTAFSGDGRNGSTGLGLAIAAELVRGHGGDIRLAEDGAPGSCFVIELPA